MAAMATALALVASGVFPLSTVLQRRGGLKAPPLSLRRPSSFARLGGQATWLVGFGLLIPGWIANPLVGVLLGIALLQERPAPPTWHKALAFAALGCALAAAVAISLADECGWKASLAGTEQAVPDPAA